MSYSEIDDRVFEWAKRYGGSVKTNFRDDVVRIIELSDDQGGRYRVLIGDPDVRLKLSIWDYGDGIWYTDYSKSNILSKLDLAYEKIESMIESKNHTRTLY